MRMGLALLCALLQCTPAKSTAGPWSLDGQMAFDRMGSLETAAVTAIAQDGQGFLWLGTQSNLLRWDGYQLHTYARNPDAPGSLRDNFIESLLVDDRGQLWVGTNSGGLSRYDPETDGFVSYPIGPGGTSDGTINALLSDRHGGLWIGTGHGIDHLNAATGRIDPLDANLPRDSIVALALDESGALWAGTRHGGLLRRLPTDDKFLSYNLPGLERSAQMIKSLYEDRAGRIWIGLELNGAFIVEPGGAAARRLLEAPQSDQPLIEAIAAIAEVDEVDESEVWLGTVDSGIVRVDTRTWTIVREQRDPTRARGLPSNQIDTLYSDRGGMMWVGTRSALSSVDPRQRLIQTFFGGAAPGLLIQDDTVLSIMAVPDGRIWMALSSGGIEIVDPVSGPVGRIRAEPDNGDRGLPKSLVITMARWQDGTVYLGTAAGLYRASPDGRVVERVQVPTQSKALDVRTLLVAEDHLWLGGLDGLFELAVLPNGELSLERRWNAELGDPRVRTLVKGPDDVIWIGTTSGVSQLATGSNRITPIPSDPRNPNLLPGGYISSMLTDRKGRFWVATFGRGIEVEQGRDAQGQPIFRRLTQSDGLPQNSVDALLMDADGNIWASTDGGLARIDPDSLAIRAYRTGQGVGIDGFFTADADITPAGDLLFGGLNGMVVVHPGRVAPAVHSPPIVVTDVRAGGQSFAPSRSRLKSGVVLGSHERSLAVEFAALDFVDAELRRYSYRLKGFDPDWLETPASRRVASYTNLPSGDYTLQLRSAGVSGDWSTPIEVPVHVQSAWYEYGAVRAAAVILLLVLFSGLVRIRTRLLRRRQVELERIVAERTAELRRNQEFLESMAYIDVLTGLPNRRVFNDDLRRLIAGCERSQSDFVLLLIDLDGFKNINDTEGHDAGDAVLVQVALRLRGLIRETDLVTRLGGDEFGLVFAQPRDKAAVDAACARIIKKLGAPISLADNTVIVGASIGVAKVSGGHVTPDDLYKAADMAMYEAKRSGRNTWRWDQPSAASVEMMSSGRYPARARPTT
jgi:diguanylate cyclase (GGDEF)-like protein